VADEPTRPVRLKSRAANLLYYFIIILKKDESTKKKIEPLPFFTPGRLYPIIHHSSMLANSNYDPQIVLKKWGGKH
jgi:hypothetical protein